MVSRLTSCRIVGSFPSDRFLFLQCSDWFPICWITITMVRPVPLISKKNCFGAGTKCTREFSNLKVYDSTNSYLISQLNCIVCLSEGIEGSFDKQVLTHWALYLSSATALSSLGWPNLWTFIYYTMLLMAALIVIVSFFFFFWTKNKDCLHFGLDFPVKKNLQHTLNFIH